MSHLGILRRAGTSIAAVVAATLLITAFAGCGGAESRYQSHMDRGKAYMTEGRLDKASIEFRNALQIRPKDGEALYMSGRVAEQRGDLRSAVGLYQSAVDNQPDMIGPRSSLGTLYVAGRAPDKALALVEPALAKHPDSAELLIVRGAARLSKKDEAGARADAEKAMQLDPASERAVGLLAGIHRGEGDLPGAVKLVSDALKRNPKSVDLHEVLSRLDFDADQPVAGQKELRALIDLKPKELRYRYELALQLSRDHQVDAAQKVLEGGVAAIPDSNAAKLVLTDFVYSQRSATDGEKVLQGFVNEHPKDNELRLALGALYQRRGALPEALAAYSKVVEVDGIHPQGLTARDRIAAIQAGQGHVEEAKSEIAAVLKENPRDAEALALRGGIEAQANDEPAAIADFRASLHEQPNAVGVSRTLARAYIANGEPGLAEEALRAAVDSAPNDVMARVELASVLAQTGRTEQAVPILEQAVKQSPTDVTAREALVRAYMAKRDFASARTAAEDLKTLRPQAASGFYLAGLVARADKRNADAGRELEHALTLQPDAIDTLLALSNLDVTGGHPDQAIKRVQGIVAQNDKNPLTQNLLGELYVNSKDSAHAEEAFSRASALAPQWPQPYRNIARVKLAQNDVPGAIAVYETGLKAAPGSADLAVEVAALYERQGHYDRAISQLSSVYAKNSRAVAIANNLAMLLVTYKNDRASLDRAKEITAPFRTSQNGTLLDTNGWVLFKRGEYTEALPVLEQAAQRSPQSKEIRYHAAMAELRAGQRDRARTNLEAALAGEAKFVGSDEARSTLAALKGSSG
ncbi:MAG TPA: tetratricopeptide repeat protein [Steroidobacteraceae bacterium]|jgi:tetratricopeptide (TPR) repeat protein